MNEADLDAALLARPGVSKRYAFNGEGYYVRARLFAFLEPGEPAGIVMRIPEPERSLAVARDGAHAFTMPRTSIRHDWIFVPFGAPVADAVDPEMLTWAIRACEHVAAVES